MLRERIRRLQRLCNVLTTNPEEPPLQRPLLMLQLVGSLPNGEGEPASPNFDFTHAEIAGQTFERGNGEALEEFKARVVDALQSAGEQEAVFSV